MRNILVIAAITIAVGVCAFFAFQPSRIDEASFWIIAEVPIVLVALFAVVRAKHDGELATLLRPSWGDFSRGIFGALVLFALSFAFARLVLGPETQRVHWIERIYFQFGDPEVLRAHASLVAVAIVVAAIADEIAWRGLVTTLLAELIGSRRAWVASAFVYAIAYLPTMWTLRAPSGALNPLLPIAALGSGLLWGAMARKFGRLAPGIVAHGFFGWAIVMMFRLWGASV